MAKQIHTQLWNLRVKIHQAYFYDIPALCKEQSNETARGRVLSPLAWPLLPRVLCCHLFANPNHATRTAAQFLPVFSSKKVSPSLRLHWFLLCFVPSRFEKWISVSLSMSWCWTAYPFSICNTRASFFPYNLLSGRIVSCLHLPNWYLYV